MSILMQIEGLQAESRIADHPGWFPLTGFRWGGQRAARTHTGGTFGTASTFSTPQLRDVVVTRQADSASSGLWNHMIQGRPTPLRFHWLRAGPGGAPTTYLEAQFDEALLVSIDVDSPGSDRPVETLTFTYRSLEFRVINVGNTLSGPQDVVTFSLGSV